jgi:hypothetical protein
MQIEQEGNMARTGLNLLNQALPKAWEVYYFEVNVNKSHLADLNTYALKKESIITNVTKKIYVNKNNLGIETNSETRQLGSSAFHTPPSKRVYLKISPNLKNTEEIRKVLKIIKDLEYPNSHYNPQSVIKLFKPKELNKHFGKDMSALYTPVLELNATTRGKYVLFNTGMFETVFDVAYFKKEEINHKRFWNMGPKDIQSIYDAIDELGIPWNLKEELGFK